MNAPEQWKLDALAVAVDALLAATSAPTPDAAVIERRADAVADAAAHITGGDYRPRYNGWHNRETWNTALWIGNTDAETDAEARAIVAVTLDPAGDGDRRARISYAAEALSAWWADRDTGERADNAGPVSDAWTYTLAVTDWHEIAESLAE